MNNVWIMCWFCSDVGVLNGRFFPGKTNHDEGSPRDVIGQAEGAGEEEDGNKMMEHFVLMMR
jgi:hypothetical protein